MYTDHEVAVIIAELFGDICACNFNDIDEWLPLKCELLDSCPNLFGVSCWEQYLKYRHCKKALRCVEQAPTVDAVEVVRCKDCKYLMFSDCYGECGKGHMGIVSPDDFCSYGERKEGAD